MQTSAGIANLGRKACFVAVVYSLQHLVVLWHLLAHVSMLTLSTSAKVLSS